MNDDTLLVLAILTLVANLAAGVAGPGVFGRGVAWDPRQRRVVLGAVIASFLGVGVVSTTGFLADQAALRTVLALAGIGGGLAGLSWAVRSARAGTGARRTGSGVRRQRPSGERRGLSPILGDGRVEDAGQNTSARRASALDSHRAVPGGVAARREDRVADHGTVPMGARSDAQTRVAQADGEAVARGGTRISSSYPRASFVGWLVPREGRDAGRAIVLADRLRLGRLEERCDVIVDHETVSGLHARIELRPEGFALLDQGSTNGTRVGGQRIDEHLLGDGDIVSLGDAELVYFEVRGVKS